MGKHRPRLTPEQREIRNDQIASDWMAGLTAQEIADTRFTDKTYQEIADLFGINQ